MHNRKWFIKVNGTKTFFDNWKSALKEWERTTSGYLCRENGTLLDCK